MKENNLIKNRRQAGLSGFTLIELLVVIAIIGILSSIVLSNLNTARSKAANSAVKSDLSSIRAQADLYRDDNNNSYYVDPTNSICTDNNVIKMLTNANTAIGETYPTNIYCYADDTGENYAVAAPLKIAEGDAGDIIYWCVDSQGSSKGETALPAANSVTCQ